MQLSTSTITPSKTARNLGVMIDDQLTFSNHILKTAQSCKFALFNITKIRPFLWEHASQLLVQALVLYRLDYCNNLLAGLPASSVKALQLIQNMAASLIFNDSKRMHATPLFINLSWLPIAARIKFKALTFAYKTSTCSAPFYLYSLLQTYVPLEACIVQVNVTLLCLAKEAQTHWWNDLPNSIRAAESFVIFKNRLKTREVTFIYIALLTIQIVSKHLTVSNWRIECQ